MMNTLDGNQLAIDQHSRQADEFAARYRDFEAAPYQDCFRYSRKRLDAVLKCHLPPNGNGLRLLDVGCGTGHQIAEYRQRGFEVAGVDGSSEMLSHARGLNPSADIRLANVDKIPFPDGSFDFVICIEVLRYLQDPSGCMRELARVLKPGGVCLVTAAPRFNLNAYWLVNRLATVLPVRNLVRLRQYFTTSLGLRSSLKACGFETVEIHGVYIGPINWIQRLTPRLLPSCLRRWEPCDAALADRAVLRDFSNMFLACAKKTSREEPTPSGN